MGSKGSSSEIMGAETYRFDRFSVNAKNRLLFRDNEEISLTPRVFDILLVFVANPGRVLEKDELINRVWDAKFVEEGNLARNVSTLRKALGGNARDHRFIVTVPGRGYRFVADVRNDRAEEPGVSASFPSMRDALEIGPGEASHNGEFVTLGVEPASPSTVPSLRKYLVWSVLAIFTMAVSIAAVLLALRYRTSTAAAVNDASSVRSIAVIRLKNLSGDDTNEYFSDGITESLVNSLSRIDGLKVVSPGSGKRFDTPEPDPVALGKQFAVDAVLEGSVRKDNDSVRLDVRLLSTKDGQVLWTGDSNEHIVKDIFAVQDNIAFSIADQLTIKLSTETGREIARRYTDNAEAYQLYLKGRFFWNKRTKEGLTKGIEYFQQAIDADPNYALAYAGIADCYDMLYDYGLVPTDESVSTARAAALKAIEIDDKLAEPHCTLGDIETHHDWNWQAAENEFKTGIELNPNYATCHHWYALHLAYRGLFDKSLQEIKTAQQLEPLSLGINANLGRILFFSRRYDQAIAQHKATLDMDPNFWSAHFKFAEVLETTGRGQEAIEEYAKSSELEGDKELADVLRKASSESGYKTAIRAWLRLAYARSKQQPVSPYQFAVLYATLGETDKALDWLEKSADERSAWMVFINVDPIFDKVRDNERFRALSKRIGFDQ